MSVFELPVFILAYLNALNRVLIEEVANSLQVLALPDFCRHEVFIKRLLFIDLDAVYDEPALRTCANERASLEVRNGKDVQIWLD